MDINDLRALFTVVTFAVFIAILFWAWSGRRYEDFRQAALLALDDDATSIASQEKWGEQFAQSLRKRK